MSVNGENHKGCRVLLRQKPLLALIPQGSATVLRDDCRSALHNLLYVSQKAISSVLSFLRSENSAFYNCRRFVGKSADMILDDRNFKGQRVLYESAKAGQDRNGEPAHLERWRGTHARSKRPKAKAKPVVSQGAMMHVKEMPVAYAASSTTTVKT